MIYYLLVLGSEEKALGNYLSRNAILIISSGFLRPTSAPNQESTEHRQTVPPQHLCPCGNNAQDSGPMFMAPL